MNRFLPKTALIEATLIILISSIIGLGVNSVHSRKVTISSERLPVPAASDSVLAEGLPDIHVSGDEGKSQLTEKATGNPIVVSTVQVRQMIARSQVILLDARSEEEHKAGSISGSINLPFENIFDYQEQLKSLPHDKWLVCYCDGPPCDLGELLAQELVNLGYSRVAYYQAGFDDWKKSHSSEQARSDVNDPR